MAGPATISPPDGSLGREAYARLVPAFSEVTPERARRWVADAVRATFTPAEAAAIAEKASALPSRSVFGLSPTASQVYLATMTLAPERCGLVSVRARNLGFRAGVPVLESDIGPPEPLVPVRGPGHALAVGFLVIAVLVTAVVLALGLAGFLTFSALAVVAGLWALGLLLVPGVVKVGRRMERGSIGARGTATDPSLNRLLLRRIQRGADPRALITESGDWVAGPVRTEA